MYGGSQRRRKSNVSDPRKMSFRRQSRRGTMALDTRKSRILKLNEQFQATARKKVLNTNLIHFFNNDSSFFNSISC